MPAKRCLILVRLSNLTDATTSPERQRAVCQQYADARGWSVVGTAEDLDVSASVTSPFERPSLRPWLERPRDYDVILFWRVDRLVRRVTHLASMIEWSAKNDVNLVSATEAHFDLSTNIGQVLAIMVGVFAQMEADAIKARTQQAYDHNIRQGKYRGGHPPFGYKPEKTDDGWRLVIDPVTAPLARDIIARVIDREKLTTICHGLNQQGIPTPQDHFRISKGLKPMDALWRPGNLGKALRSPTLLGQIVVTDRATAKDKNGKRIKGQSDVLRDDSGAPIIRAEPLVDRDTFDRLQRALDEMNGKRTPYRKSESLLLRVIYCGICDRPMYKVKGRTHYYYTCPSASFGKSCGNKRIRMDLADLYVEEFVLLAGGDEERMRREYDPGSDTAAELAEVDAELVDVADLVGKPAFRSGPARDRLMARAEALSARRDALAAVEHRPAGYRLVGTGESFRDYWARLSPQEKNMELRDLGIRLRADQVTPDLELSWNSSRFEAMGRVRGVPEEMIKAGMEEHRPQQGRDQ